MGEKTKEDTFEASEMHDGARIVHRDKRVSRGLALLLGIPGLLTMALGVVIAFINASSSKPVPAEALPIVVGLVIALGVLLMTLGIVFGVLRTLVTERAVHVKYGLWGPTIPLDAIRSCKVVEYDWTEFGGWGIRLGKNGTWAYVPASGPVIELVYDDGKKEKRVLVGAQNAEATALAIDRARGATHLRVEEEAKPDVAKRVDGPAKPDVAKRVDGPAKPDVAKRVDASDEREEEEEEEEKSEERKEKAL
jgi:hypothetical protein